MRTADKYFNGYKRLIDGVGYWVNEEDFKAAIVEAQKDAIMECCNKAKTYKVGNGGSWYDAAVDRGIFIKLLEELK